MSAMFYEEQAREGVLCYRSTPTGDWVSMPAERLTAVVLELRQRHAAVPVFVPQPYPVLAPAPQPSWAPPAPRLPPYTITCGIGRHPDGTVG